MTSSNPSGKGLPQAFLGFESSSFVEFLEASRPELLPGRRGGEAAPGWAEVPHGTTIVAMTCEGGVVVAGDRRGTMGNVIAQRDAEKVFRADEYSAVAYAGAAAIGVELIRLFQVELEHYEKMEGRSLSFQGKANRLATLVRGNINLAAAGLVAIPIFAGFDEESGTGRIFGYDYVGGRYEERDHHGIGSGSVFALSALKKFYRPGMSADDAVLAAVQALYDAAEEDSATGGPDLARKLFPIVATVTAEGFRKLPEEEIEAISRDVVEGRMNAPGGPAAPLR
jgi:proteasome beta subunit